MPAPRAAPKKARPRRPNDGVPPHNADAERSVLGAILLDAERVLDLAVERGVIDESFHVPAHRVLFEVLLEMQRDSRAIDLITVGDRLREQNRLNEIGGALFLEELLDSTPTSAYAAGHIDIVRRDHILRRIIDRAREAIEHCYGVEEDVDALLGRVEQSFFEISDSQRGGVRRWNDLVDIGMREIEAILESKRDITGVPTGYVNIDRYLHGLQAGDMIVLAARPSMGKTSLALNIAENIALGHVQDRQPRPVAVFSLEMSAESLVRRMLCSHAEVPSGLLYKGFLSATNHQRLIQAAAKLSKAPLYLDDTPSLDIVEVRARARRLKRRYDVQLIVLDYLQMLACREKSRDGRQQEVAAISNGLKAMAKELKTPVLVLSQLSRAPENRDKTAVPKLSDLRDSGSIEQDADVVALLRRPCKYRDDEHAEDMTLAILDIAKHRNGPVGEAKLNFFDDIVRFKDREVGVDDVPQPAD